jgi:Ca-activated chloride channel family protein
MLRSFLHRKTLITLTTLVGLALISGLLEAAPEPPTPEPPTVSKTADPKDINIGEETTIILKVKGAGGGISTPVDIVFALDSSGSMGCDDCEPPRPGNDPTGKRREAAKQFLDEMDPEKDRAGVVSWDEDIDSTCPAMKCITCGPGTRCDRDKRPVCEPLPSTDCTLPNDFTYLKGCIDQVDSYGSTNMTLGLHAAVDLIECGGRDEHEGQDVGHYIIFLSDGKDTVPPYFDCDDPNGPVQRASDLGIVIYAIGLGDKPDEAALMCMADRTGGQYYYAPTAENLEAIFDAIRGQLTNAPHCIDVEETIQSHLTIKSISPEPDSFDPETKKIIWEDIDDCEGLLDGESRFFEIIVSPTQCGNGLPVDVLEESNVDYSDSEGNYVGSVPIPQETINVIGQTAKLQIVDYRWSTDPAHQPPYTIKIDPATGIMAIRAYIEARIENQGPGDAKNVTATISDPTDCLEIVDGKLTFGDIPAYSDAWSEDDYCVEGCGSPRLCSIEYEDDCGELHEISCLPESLPAPPFADLLSRLKNQLILEPPVTKLYPNYPNPFNPETWIPYQVAKDADVVVKIFDISGQLIKTIALGHQQAGFYISRDKAAYWDGRNQFGEQVSSGVYFYNLHAGAFTATRKMIIMK